MNIAESTMVPVFSPATEIEKYLSASNKVDTGDLDWGLAASVGLTDDEVWLLTYFSDIEAQTIVYFRDLMSTDAALEADVVAFLTMWNYEEFFHGKALTQLMAACGHDLEKERVAKVRQTASLSEKLESLGATVLSKIYHNEFPAVHAAWGAVQEITTLHGYQELGKHTTNPVLKTLCDRIAKQERRHFAWYFNSARERLSRSPRAQWLAKFLLSRFWSPVGAGVKPKEDVEKVIRLLFSGEHAMVIARDIDTKIGALPGLQGIGLMVPYMQQAFDRLLPAAAPASHASLQATADRQ